MAERSNMITRVSSKFVLSGDDNLDTLIINANMLGYPFVMKDNKVYQVKVNNNQTRVRHYDVTDKVMIF
jgi:hypothetical protein